MPAVLLAAGADHQGELNRSAKQPGASLRYVRGWIRRRPDSHRSFELTPSYPRPITGLLNARQCWFQLLPAQVLGFSHTWMGVCNPQSTSGWTSKQLMRGVRALFIAKNARSRRTAQLCGQYVRPATSAHKGGWQGAHVLEGPVGQVKVVDVAAAGRVGANLPRNTTPFGGCPWRAVHGPGTRICAGHGASLLQLRLPPSA